MSDQPEGTLKPTPKRIREFRKRGEIALSRDVVSAAALAGGVTGLVLSAGGAASALTDLTRRSALAGDGVPFPDLAAACGHAFVTAVGPALIGAALGAIVAIGGQIGWPPARKSLGFDLARLSPGANLRQVLSPGAAMRRVGGAVAKLAMIAAVVVLSISGLGQLEPVAASVAAPHVAAVVKKVLIAATAAFAAVAALDYILARRRLAKKMKMTPDAAKREHREQEGDPAIKGQRKRRMRELARRRISAAVKSAAVVVVNPTHFAVALRYDEGTDRAPIVVAKGSDEAAEKIRELARSFGVPVLSRPPLARALHKTCREGREVPVALYRAVAEVLAYIYRLRKPGVAS